MYVTHIILSQECMYCETVVCKFITDFIISNIKRMHYNVTEMCRRRIWRQQPPQTKYHHPRLSHPHHTAVPLPQFGPPTYLYK